MSKRITRADAMSMRNNTPRNVSQDEINNTLEYMASRQMKTLYGGYAINPLYEDDPHWPYHRSNYKNQSVIKEMKRRHLIKSDRQGNILLTQMGRSEYLLLECEYSEAIKDVFDFPKKVSWVYPPKCQCPARYTLHPDPPKAPEQPGVSRKPVSYATKQDPNEHNELIKDIEAITRRGFRARGRRLIRGPRRSRA